MSARIEPSGEFIIVTAKLSWRYGLCIYFVYIGANLCVSGIDAYLWSLFISSFSLLHTVQSQ